jgi:hypothetical protein
VSVVAKKVADSIRAAENTDIMRLLRSRYHCNVSLRKVSVRETRLNGDQILVSEEIHVLD